MRAADAGEKFPAGKDGDATGGDGFFDQLGIVGGFDAFAAEARVDRGEKTLGDGGFGERQETGFVEGRGGALGFWIEFADRLDFVAEELEAHGAIGFR